VVGWGRGFTHMSRRAVSFIVFICTCAVASATARFALGPAPVTAPRQILILLAVLGLVAEVLVLLLPSGASTSSASIPFLAAALLAPDWTAVAAVSLAVAISQAIRRRGFAKLIFNLAQAICALSLGVLVYRGLGGTSLFVFDRVSFFATTTANALPGIAFIAVFFAANSLAVSGIIAASEGKSPIAVWRGNYLSTAAYEILSAPFVFLFAWVTVRVGPIGAAVLAASLLGLRQLYKNKLELERAHQELLELMVKAIEARDPYTSGHSRRVQHHSMVIATACGLSPHEVERLGIAALLHDVGKIHEKYAPILRKPDKLSAEEWKIMEAHPADGAALVSTVSRLRDLVPAIRHHHERWDGAGYPDKIRGHDIPFSSRVIMLADTIDAMTTDRPYRHALSAEAVRAEVIRCKGTQFDPDICEKLLNSPLWDLIFTRPTPRTDLDPIRPRFRGVSQYKHRVSLT